MINKKRECLCSDGKVQDFLISSFIIYHLSFIAPASTFSILPFPMRCVLFLCTGNYYRSRYAEALFNHRARAAGWPWRAFSRGLQTHLIQDAISPHTRRALLHAGIPLAQTAPSPRALTPDDFAHASIIIALKESEHRPILRARFPNQEPRIEYWRVHDLDVGRAADTLAAIEKLVHQLAQRLLAADRATTSRAVPIRARAARPRASGRVRRPSRRANAAG
jgi:protein-tyrosine phosphatase